MQDPWLAHEGLQWTLGHLLKPVHEGQRREEPFAGHRLQELLVVVMLFTLCKERRELTDMPGWSAAVLSSPRASFLLPLS